MEISLVDIAEKLNSFQWWMVIIGSDLECALDLTRDLKTKSRSINVIVFPQDCGLLLMIPKKELSFYQLMKCMRDHGAMGPGFRMNPNASTDVIIPLSENSQKMAAFLIQCLPPIQPGYMRGEAEN
jgi:hypothetical protein